MHRIVILTVVLPFLCPGNFHALMLFKDDKELEKVSAAVHRLAHRAIALDGTCKSSSPYHYHSSIVSLTMTINLPTISLHIGTGEHGVGVGKKEYLTEELGENTVELMRTVKAAIDPLGIMNPGKVTLIPCILPLVVLMLRIAFL